MKCTVRLAMAASPISSPRFSYWVIFFVISVITLYALIEAVRVMYLLCINVFVMVNLGHYRFMIHDAVHHERRTKNQGAESNIGEGHITMISLILAS